jgi:hypothetical protein
MPQRRDELALPSVAAVTHDWREQVGKDRGEQRRFAGSVVGGAEERAYRRGRFLSVGRRLLMHRLSYGRSSPESVRKMSDDRQYAPATLKVGDKILPTWRSVCMVRRLGASGPRRSASVAADELP